MKQPLKNGTKVTVRYSTMFNSKWHQRDIGDSPTTYEGVIFDSYQLEGKEGFFYNIKFDTCSKYGLIRDKLEVVKKKKTDKQLSSKKPLQIKK